MDKSTYNRKGLYNSYDKKHKERDALDYYATPPKEVENILNILKLDFNESTILEPCVGGGHMLEGIFNYCEFKAELDGSNPEKFIITDIQDRGALNYCYKKCPDKIDFVKSDGFIEEQYGLDFLDDDYPYNSVDYIIMNPPYSTIEPFVIRALEIAQKGVLMLGRLQFLEGKSRYENILKDNPPTDVYVYVDRIKCYKNGDFSDGEASAQAYAWFYWDKTKVTTESKIHWIRREK